MKKRKPHSCIVCQEYPSGANICIALTCIVKSMPIFSVLKAWTTRYCQRAQNHTAILMTYVQVCHLDYVLPFMSQQYDTR